MFVVFMREAAPGAVGEYAAAAAAAGARVPPDAAQDARGRARRRDPA
jgi:hypothetical protein